MDFLNNGKKTSTGRNVGIDFGFYGLEPNSKDSDVLAGYEHARALHEHPKRSTATIRKWLNLRLHAYERMIHFSESIKPNFLDELMSRSKGRCPYTGVKLTKGTLEGSDWSIDRVINGYGYIPANIVIMATSMNKAKSNLSIEDIESIVATGRSFKDYPNKVWKLVLNDMEVAKNILDRPNEIEAELKKALVSGESVLIFLLNCIVKTDNLDEKKIYTKELFELANCNYLLKRKLKKLIRTIVIKAGTNITKDVCKMIGRSGKLKREITLIGDAINTDTLRERFLVNNEIMKLHSEEAINTSRKQFNTK